MAKYKVEYADTFDKAMKKLDRRDQRFIIHWIDQHLNNVDFPTSPGKSLKGNFQDMFDFEWEIIESLLKSITISL